MRVSPPCGKDRVGVKKQQDTAPGHFRASGDLRPAPARRLDHPRASIARHRYRVVDASAIGDDDLVNGVLTGQRIQHRAQVRCFVKSRNNDRYHWNPFASPTMAVAPSAPDHRRRGKGRGDMTRSRHPCGRHKRIRRCREFCLFPIRRTETDVKQLVCAHAAETGVADINLLEAASLAIIWRQFNEASKEYRPNELWPPSFGHTAMLLSAGEPPHSGCPCCRR